MYITSLRGLENYEYAVHKLWWMQCLEEEKKQLQGGENCMTNFTIKLPSPNDYGEQVNQKEGGRTYIALFSMYLTLVTVVFNLIKLCEVEGKTTVNNTFKHFTKLSKMYTRR
jgi:hypothetical protein